MTVEGRLALIGAVLLAASLSNYAPLMSPPRRATGSAMSGVSADGGGSGGFVPDGFTVVRAGPR